MNAPHPIRVALVEDDLILREEIGHFLRQQGLTVCDFMDGQALFTHLHAHATDLVVLDVNLPGMSGFEVAQQLKRDWPRLGIVMLTARTALSDRVAGYDCGADIFLPKPTEPDELLAALRNLHRRVGDDAPTARYWQLDMTRRVLRPAGSTVVLPLTALELALLVALTKAPNRQCEAVGLCAVLERIHSDPPFSKHALENLVSRLRKKVAEAGLVKQDQFLKSIWGWGYQLCVPLAVLQA